MKHQPTTFSDYTEAQAFDDAAAKAALEAIFGSEKEFVDPFERSEEGLLGNTANYVGQSNAEFWKQASETDGQELSDRIQNRRIRYKMQRSAASLLPGYRVGNCGWAVQSVSEGVCVNRTAKGTAFFEGLQTCGSVWHCPCCSQKISKERQEEMNALLRKARNENLKIEKKRDRGDELGWHPVMLTLTHRHSEHDDLAEQITKMKDAKRSMRGFRRWKKAKAEGRIFGSVTATEVTYGQHAGWHTHFHEILIIRARDEDEAVEFMKQFSPSWIVSLNKYGLDGEEEYAFHVQGATGTHNYICKWGAAEEMTLSRHKRGKGDKLKAKHRSPQELLYDFTFENDERAGQLWAEYARAFHGKRQLVWSDGLKDWVDFEPEEPEDEGEIEHVAHISASHWNGDFYDPKTKKNVGVKYRRLLVIEAAEISAELAQEVIYSDLYDPDLRPWSITDDGGTVPIDRTDLEQGLKTVETDFKSGRERGGGLEIDALKGNKRWKNYSGEERKPPPDRACGAVSRVRQKIRQYRSRTG